MQNKMTKNSAQASEPTDEQVEAIIKSVRWGDGWDGDQWDRALVRAALAASTTQPPKPEATLIDHLRKGGGYFADD